MCRGSSYSSGLVKSKELGCLRGQGSKYGQFDNQHGMTSVSIPGDAGGRVVHVRSCSCSSCKIRSIRIKLLKHLKTPRQKKILDFNFNFDFSCISSPGKAGRWMHPPASCRSPRPRSGKAPRPRIGRISSAEKWARESKRKTTLKIRVISQISRVPRLAAPWTSTSSTLDHICDI